MSGIGGRLRPRYGRIAALVAATSTTLVSLVGTLVTGPAEDADGSRPAAAASAALAAAPSTGLRASLSVGVPPLGTTAPPSTAREPTTPEPAATAPAVPRDSGSGHRVVFSESEQRVWLVRDGGGVERTYPVSGSVYDNLDPGSYEVFSHSETATGIDGSALRYMVRFTHGDNAAIGFHSIPLMDGEPMQTRAELGTPLSHGCVRQALPDAKALWRFAPVGTQVVVTA